MKKYIIGLIFGVALAVGGSVGAVIVTNTQSMELQNVSPKLTVQEQINLGYQYDKYTGRKLETPPLSVTEMRFRAIESRLSALENK